MHLLAIDPALQMATFSPCAHMTEREREEREERERKDSLVSFVGVISILFTYLFLKIFWDVDCF